MKPLRHSFCLKSQRSAKVCSFAKPEVASGDDCNAILHERSTILGDRQLHQKERHHCLDWSLTIVAPLPLCLQLTDSKARYLHVSFLNNV